MASGNDKACVFAFLVHCFLFLRDGRGGLDRGPKDDPASVAYTAESSAGMIGLL